MYKYEIFLEVAENFTDTFWIGLFIDLAKGKCPKKVSISSTSVVLNTRKKTEKYSYEDKDAKTIATELKAFLSRELLIFSEQDISDEQEAIDDNFDQYSTAADLNDWKKIKNRKMKDNLLVEYVLANRSEHSLTWPQARQLLCAVQNALFFYHTHGSEDIIMEEGRVSSIKDIEVIKSGRTVEIINKRCPEDPQTDNSKSLIDKWVSYLKIVADELK